MAADSRRIIACAICVAADASSVCSRAYVCGVRRCLRRGRNRLVVVGRAHATDALGFDRRGSDACRDGDHRIAAATRLTISLMLVPLMDCALRSKTPRQLG